MSKKTIWKKSARAKYKKTTRWYFDNMGRSAARKFMQGITEDVKRISTHPGIGKREPLLADQPENFQSLVSHRNTQIVYYTDNERIYIVDFWDCRRNPSDMANEIGQEKT